MDDGLAVESNPILLVPLVVDLNSVFQLRAGFCRTCRAGRFEIDRVQTLLGETRVFRE